MNFDGRLWDGSDPLYAPGLNWNGTRAYWKVPAKYRKAGYAVTTMRLPGEKGDGEDLARAARCRELTQEMMRWWNDQEQSAPAYGTWKYLIGRYKSDEFSPYREVKANTSEVYDYLLARWENAIGHMEIGDLDYSTIKTIQRTMQENGRTDSNIHRMFTMLRTVSRYGKALHLEGARDVSETLSEIRIKTAPARSVAPSREQIEAIIAEADKAGARHFALGVLLQYWFMLRAVDVRGQWLKDDGSTGGIIRNGKRWQDGLTWDMVSDDLSTFTKVISKTARTMPEPYVFDLTATPDIQRRMAAVRPEKPVGPVIVSERFGLPYERSAWSNTWRQFRAAAGITDDIRIMDARAGGITEAKALGVDAYALRDAGQHANISTTSRYARGRSAAANKVVKLRRDGNAK